MHCHTHPYEYVYIARFVQSNRLHSHTACRPGLQAGLVRARQGYKFKFVAFKVSKRPRSQVLACVRAIPKTTQVASVLTDSGVQHSANNGSAPPLSALTGPQVSSHNVRRHATFDVHRHASPKLPQLASRRFWALGCGSLTPFPLRAVPQPPSQDMKRTLS